MDISPINGRECMERSYIIASATCKMPAQLNTAQPHCGDRRNKTVVARKWSINLLSLKKHVS